MRKLLLNPTPLFRKLRQLSMLLTLLLVPLGALGQTITVAGSAPDQSGAITGTTGTDITGTVSFDTKTNTLTLNDATITGNIVWTNTGENLTIQMSGKNSVNGNITATATCSLHIEKIANAESATLKYTGNMENLNPVTTLNNAEFTYNSTNYHYYTTAAVYELSFGTIQVHGIEGELGYKDNIFQNDGTPTATFDGTNIITLNGATLTNFIHWAGNANLTIELFGTNSITTSGSCIDYEGSATPQISFTAGGTAGSECSLKLRSTGTASIVSVINGFSNANAPTMETGLYWIPTSTSATITNSILGGGSGTTTDPFIISSYDHLKDFATYVNNGILTTENKYFKLGDDIDCTGKTDFEPIGIEGNVNSLAINFKGTFDGNNKTIKNLSITGVEGENVGLFRCLDGGTITQLTLDGCTIIGGNSSSVIGGIVGYVSNNGTNNGTVNECIVQNNSSISSNTSSQNPTVGGIVGYLDSGTITNCIFQNSHVNAESSLGGAVSSPNVNAGGIVGKASGTVSNCQVKGTAEISAIYSVAEKENTKAGAIIGDNMRATLSENAYDYSVKTKVQNSTSTELTTYSGYTQRGIGGMLYNSTTQQNEPYPDITENNGAVMYTKIVSLPTENSAGTVAGVDETYYKVDGTSLYVAPGQTATINATPSTANNFALAWLQAVKTGTTDVVICDSTNITGGGRQYTFTMPDAEVTVNVSWDELYNLWIGDTQVTSANAAHILGENNTTVTFTAADPNLQTSANTLTLNGATLEVPVKVGLSLTFDIKGTNSITTNTTCIQIDNTTSTIPTLTFKSTSDEVGNLTLKNTDNSNTGVISSGFSGYFTISNELTLLTSGNHTLSDGEVHEAQLVPFYGVQVGETLVHSGNATDVLGDGKISFNKNTSTLTLNNANAGGISTSLAQLTIELVGNNTLTETASQPVLRSLNDSKVTINIQSTAETRGMLTMNMPYTNNGTNNGCFYDDNVTVAIIPPLDVISGSLTGNDNNVNTVIIGETYNLSVAGTAVTILNKDNVLGDGKISFTPSSNTLTLNGAKIGDGGINYRGETDFTIALNGSNSIENTGGTAAIFANTQTTYSFNFVKATGASSAELSLKWGSGNIAISAERPTLGSGLYWKPIEETTLIITDDPEFIIIDDYAMTERRTTINGTSGTITYNPTDKVLTLNGFTKEFGAKHAIKTGVTGLKVKLTGESTINCAADSTVFYAFSNSASIQFVKVDATSKLNMVGTAIDKFADGSVTYDGLVLYSTNYIAIPEPPTMALNNNDKVELTITYSGGTIATKYSIDYADETADVTNATYSDPFEMAAPGTVTAWVEANGATSSTVKGKHFGYESKTFTMKRGETKAVVLAPAIEDADNIALADNPYASDAEGVATLSNAVINAIGIGKANLSTTLANTNAQEHTVILNKDNKFTIEVNVGAIMEGVTFAPNMLYATYCNTTSKNMTVPEGMTAYAVTGTEGNNVTTEVVEFLPMNVPLLLMRSNASTEVGMSLEYDGTATAPATNILNFTNSDLATTGKEYVLYNDEFVKATSTIPQKHCYLFITNPAPTRGYYSIGHGNDGSTAIDDTLIDNEETTNDDWYDLQGRRIQKPTKAGIYIVNGKKMIVK